MNLIEAVWRQTRNRRAPALAGGSNERKIGANERGYNPGLEGNGGWSRRYNLRVTRKSPSKFGFARATEAKVALAMEIIPLLSTGKRRPLGGSVRTYG